MQTDVKILAHRGGMGRAPENTIAAFQQTLDDGADAFECDVCLTQDEEPVLIHAKFDDADIAPVTGCAVPLSELDLGRCAEPPCAGFTAASGAP